MEERVKDLLDRVSGEQCWSVIVGSDADFPFVLHLGEKLRRSLRLANPRLSFLQRTYEGSISLLVECAWRLDGPDRVIASCWDPPEVRREALENVVDQAVTVVRAEPPGYDLQVAFESGYALRCLSVETDVERPRDNWHLYTPEALLRVGPRGRPEIRTTEEAKVAFRRLRLSVMGESDEPSMPRSRPWPRPAPEADPPSSSEPVPEPEPRADGTSAPSDETERPESSGLDSPTRQDPGRPRLRPVDDPPP